MKDRNKILIQILVIINHYDVEIININFININVIKTIVEFTIKHEQDNFIFRYIYEKDNKYEIHSFGRYFRDELDRRLKEE